MPSQTERDIRRNLDNPRVLWVKSDALRGVTLDAGIINLFAQRRGLISDIRGMYAQLDDPAHAHRFKELYETIVCMEDDLDWLNDGIARKMAVILAVISN